MTRMPQVPPSPSYQGVSADPQVDPEDIALARSYNEMCLHWDDVRYRDCGPGGPEHLWSIMKRLRRNIGKELTFGDVHVSYFITNGFDRLLHEMDMSMSTGFMTREGFNSKRKLMYSVSSMMEESIASSQIEGAVTTTKVAKRMLRSGRTPSNKSELMVQNNYSAMQLIKLRRDEPLSVELIKSIHKVISHGTLDDSSYEGEFRTDDSIAVRDVFTGETYHEPVDHRDIGRMMDDLCDYANDDSVFVHPVIKGIVLHFMLAYIHPFMDGNGRVARSLFYWCLLRNGYDVVEYLSISKAINTHRGRYYRAYLLSETDGNDITYFIKYNLDMIRESVETFSGYLDRKRREQEELTSEIRGSGMSLRQREILKFMIDLDEPCSIYEVASKHQISEASARRDINDLVSRGYLVGAGRRGHRALFEYSGGR